jgi:hypothetical protein
MNIKSEIIYKGEKFFEKYQKKIEILLVNHEEFSCIEVIVHGVRVENKSARLYLSSAALVTVTNVEHFNRTLAVKHQSAQRLNLPFNPDFEMKKLALSMITTVLIEGLNIIPSVFMSEFDLCFELNGRHYVEDNNSFEFAVKPRYLAPFTVDYSLVNYFR